MYCTPGQFINHFGSQTTAAVASTVARKEDIDGWIADSSTANAAALGTVAIIQHHLEDAEELINAHVATYYVVPVVNYNGSILQQVARDVVRYTLDETPLERVAKDYERALATLGNIQKGMVLLVGAETVGGEPGKVTPATTNKTLHTTTTSREWYAD